MVSFRYAARQFARLMETGGTRRFARATPLLGQASPEWCGPGLARMSEADGCNGRNNSVRVNVLDADSSETDGFDDS